MLEVTVEAPDMLSDGVRDAIDSAVRCALLGIAQGGDIPADEAAFSARQVVRVRRPYGVIDGQFMAGMYQWGGFGTSLLRDVCRHELPGDLWDRARAFEPTLQNACWWYPHRDFLMVCEHPREIHREPWTRTASGGWRSHRLHASDRRFRDLMAGWLGSPCCPWRARAWLDYRASRDHHSI
jgi:hypothetical protein